MGYINAADVLPKELLEQIQNYVKGSILYIPNDTVQKKWGEKSGSRQYYLERNKQIKTDYKKGKSVSEICNIYGLSPDRIKQIIYS